MLSNVVDVDFEAMKISLTQPAGSVVLFDFAAAFPSVSQEYMWKVLAHIGVAPGPLAAIRSLYCNNLHYIKVKSHIFPSFTSTSGVRQGCPLSPLLFAVVADLLLRRLHGQMPDILVRAFADDTAVVTPDFEKHAPLIMQVFNDFAKISSLHLNLHKTVLIPLWESCVSSVKDWLRASLPDWSDIEVAWGARYLGFIIGPDRGEKSWDKASRRFCQRVLSWSQLHVGMYLNAQIYRALCLSIFSFLCQLEDPPVTVLNLEPWALRRLAPGPGNWIRPLDLAHLRRFGHPFDFASIQQMALAAKVRVYHFEPQLNVKRLHGDLLNLFATAPMKHKAWDEWYNKSHVLILTRAHDQAEELGINKSSMRNQMAKRHGSIGQCEASFRKRFQYHVFRKLVQLEGYNHELVLRGKLARWRITEPPEGALARRACRVLHQAFDIMPVRVATVLFRTWLNGWCTARRFQLTSSTCLFGCVPGSMPGCHDSIEHYSHCPVVRRFALNHLNLPSGDVGSLQGFLCLGKMMDVEVFAVQCLLVFSVYAATNKLRHGSGSAAVQSFHDLLLQCVHQGAAQSPFAQKAVMKNINAKHKRRRINAGEDQ